MSGPLPAFLSPLTTPASWIYERAVAIRNSRFDRHINIERIDRPVISIGNITTGGTGKTPMVARIAQMLRDAGHHPAIAMRGYKAAPGMLSDEQAEYSLRLPDVHVIANPDRAKALREFLPVHQEIDCVLLDDGFQHRQLHRDLDLVLIDATAETLNDRLLPVGNLREPLANLRRADAVIITHAESEISNVHSRVERLHGRPPLAAARHIWNELEIHKNAATTQRVAVDWLRGKRVVTMLGIGKPEHVARKLQDIGALIAADIPCSDHEQFDQAKLTVANGLCSGCDAMVVTGKDWVKIRNLIDWTRWTRPIVVPRLEIEFLHGEDALRELTLSTVRKAIPNQPVH